MVPNKPRTPLRNVRVEDDIWKTALVAAKANGENLSVVIRRALIAYIKENEATPGQWTTSSSHTLGSKLEGQS